VLGVGWLGSGMWVMEAGRLGGMSGWRGVCFGGGGRRFRFLGLRGREEGGGSRRIG
jgi:hypothetical protein